MTTISPGSNAEADRSASAGNSPHQIQPPSIPNDLPERNKTMHGDMFRSAASCLRGEKLSEVEDRLFSLKWNEFNKHLTEGFSDLYYTQDFADVTLCCEGKSIHAHKIVLAMCSPYFREIFKENPCRHPVVIIKGISFQDLQRILRFIYFGQVSIVKNKIQDFIEAAELIKLDGITPKNSARREREERRHKENMNVHSGPPSPVESNYSGPSASTINNVDYQNQGQYHHGINQVSKEFFPLTNTSNTNPNIHDGAIEERICGQELEPESPSSRSPSFLEARYGSPRVASGDAGAMTSTVPSSSKFNHRELACVQPSSGVNHGIKKNSSRWASFVWSPDAQRDPTLVANAHDAFPCIRTPPIDHTVQSSARPLSNDSNASRIPSTGSSCGETESFIEPPILRKVPIMEECSPECTPESFANCCPSEYELSIRPAESTYSHIKSFTTPSGMVVTSTLHGLGHPTSSTGGSWAIGHVKPCTATSASLQTSGKLSGSGFRLPLVPAVHHPNGSMISKSQTCIEGLSQSSVPAKKRFSQVGHRFLGYAEQQQVSISEETVDLHRTSQLVKPGIVVSASQGSPCKMITAVTSSSTMSTIPRLKSHRQSHVPSSARYTTAEVDALVDSVNDHSGPYVPCKICDKLVKRERLRAHIHECHLVHGEKIICPHCGVGLKSKGSYRVHVWRHRRGVLAKGTKSKWMLSQRPRVSTP
ncbi:unnamed protein product [Allacma fusca]|uniref:BTB domain-containing protein n=1 Tax=Allacma fusca TaxID=39272 RepID=A0A8J2PFI9_9HEXA|nr:unnamed protein product [Allacma fusca]